MSKPVARLRALASSTLALAALTLSGEAAAAGDPTLDWWTIETPHFRVHYPSTVEPIAERVAMLAERVNERLTGPMGHTPSSATEIVITDDTDFANGSATALPYNTIRLYVTAPDDMSALNDYDDWYLELLTHEYTHILHIDNVSGLPAVLNAIIGKTFIPNQVQPRWIIEGLAVVEETAHTSGGRLRSTIFDMFMRADVLEDNIASLDQISSYPFRYPGGNAWYLYGSRFLGWISEVYGPNTLRAVAAEYGSNIIPWGINRSIRRATGRTYVDLYEGFKDHLRRRYAKQVREVERRGLREGTQITRHGIEVGYPRFVPANARKGAGDELVYFRGDGDARAGIYRIPLAAPRDGERTEELVARTNSPSVATFTPDGSLVFNSASIWNHVYWRDDLFQLPRGATSQQGDEPARRRLTEGLRATAPDVSPDGRRVVFTVNRLGTTFLEIADVAGDGSVQGRRDLVPSARFEQAYTPRFSPDGSSVAYSAWTAGGYRDIRVVDVKTGSFRAITRDRALDMQPAWSPDGATLYFTSDRSGVPNIYAYDLAKGALKQVTNARVGATQPAISADNKTLVYVGYTTKGFDLFTMPLDPARFLEAPPAPTDRPDPPADAPSPSMPLRRSRYNPLPTLAPHSYRLDLAPGKFGQNAVTISAFGGDVVGHHSLSAALVIDPSAPSPEGSLDYTYGRLPIDFSLRGFYAVNPRTGYRINDAQPVFAERTVGLTAAASYSLPQDFSRHSFGASYSVAAFRGELPVGPKLDPYSTITVDPASGAIGVVHLGYSYSNVEGSYRGAGASRGVSLSMGVDFADLTTGGDYTLRSFSASFNAYVPMPWPGHHTLALRTSGAVSAGSYPRGNRYYVGGYDLERVSLLDTITTGAFNGAVVLRGYEPSAYGGREFLLQAIEYRAPLFKPDHGLFTLPIYLQRVDASAFIDFGGAFNDLRLRDIKLFTNGYLLDSPDLHTSIGAELWLGTTLAYTISTQFRLGYAYGFSAGAVPGGQLYFIASSAF